MKTPLTASKVADMKRDAKRIARTGKISHNQALEQLAREAGFNSWHEAQTTALAPHGAPAPDVTREAGKTSMVVPGTALRLEMDGEDAKTEAALRGQVAKLQGAAQRQQAAHDEGIPALKRLYEVAHGNSGQCRYIAACLLGLYNGTRFPFDLTDLRCVDVALFDDCIRVLRMDSMLRREVHTYFPNGGPMFEKLARRWGIADAGRLKSISTQIAERGVISFGGELGLEREIRHALDNTFPSDEPL
jgi:hypothetical protein